MRKTIQEKIEEITCDQCGKSIYNQEPIRLDEYYRSEWESERHLDSVECLVNYLISSESEFEGIYHYHLTFPSGEYVREFTKYLRKRNSYNLAPLIGEKIKVKKDKEGKVISIEVLEGR